jgi:hypothetical protein
MRTTTLDLATWAATGLLHLPGFASGVELDAIRGWVDEVEAWPPAAGGWLHHDETTASGAMRRCRTENIVPFHAGLRTLLTTGQLPDMASTLLDEPAVLYKEKINYKHSDGAGFAPHQDAPAYPFVRQTVTCLLAIDDATAENGCLAVVEGRHREELPIDGVGCIPAEYADGLEWRPVEMSAGDLLWFHWYTPHRSGTNRSLVSRRALYLTYNPAADGDLRTAYYEAKRQALQEPGGDGRISLIGHFQGDARPATAQRA